MGKLSIEEIIEKKVNELKEVEVKKKSELQEIQLELRRQ